MPPTVPPSNPPLPGCNAGQNGVWDAGFKGRSEFILVVGNPAGLKLKQNARVVQLTFLRINEVRKGYQGVYQNL